VSGKIFKRKYPIKEKSPGIKDKDEAPCYKQQGINAELRRSPPALAIHPCSKLQGILAKANKI
jgi:hypothetical protein